MHRTLPPLSPLVARLPRGRSDAWAVTDRGADLARAGADVTDLGVGDPDFATPLPIAAALERALRAGRTHYAPPAGEPALRDAVAVATAARTSAAIASEQVFIFPGAQCALFATLAVVAGPGDEVILLEPAYTTFEKCVAAAGARAIGVRLDPRNGFALDVDAVAAAMTERTRAIVVNSPSNPSGAVFPRASLERLTELCAARGVWCISDEVYHALVYDGPHVSPLATPAGPACTIVIDGLSKSHAMTGWRIGWAIAPPAVAAGLDQLTPSLLFGVNQFVQDAAAFAVDAGPGLVAPIRAALRARRAAVLEALVETDRLRALPPAGGLFVLVDVTRAGLDGLRFADLLLDRERIVVVPGAAFGAAARGCVRIGLTLPADRLRHACLSLCRVAEQTAVQPV